MPADKFARLGLLQMRETATLAAFFELAESLPMHVFCKWIGSTHPVSQKHYLQVTDDHIVKVLQNPVQ